MTAARFETILRDRVPSEERDDVLRGAVERAETFVSSLPPAARRLVQLSARITRGPGADRVPALRRLATVASDLLVMCYLEEPAVRAACGYEPDPWIARVAGRRQETWRDDIAAHLRLLHEPAALRPAVAPGNAPGGFWPGTELPAVSDVDVVIVGSGAGGGVVAAELAEAGLSVAVLEEGGYHRPEEFTTATLDMLQQLYRDSGATSTLGRAPIQYSEGRCVGGSTTVNGGMAFRAAQRVLDGWAARAGLDFELDAEYARVERFLSVGPPDPASIGTDQALLRDGAQRLGWRVVESRRAHVHCGGCNVCVWGCPTGAKQSTLVSYLPRAVSFGATVWTGCRAERVVLRGKRAVGIHGRVPATGATFTVHARTVVLAAGAVQTPVLLLRSGIRTPSRQVGRNLALHPGAAVAAVFDDVVDGWQGAHQSYQVREFEEEGVILAAVNLPPSLAALTLGRGPDAVAQTIRDYPRMVTAGVLVEDTGSGRVRTVGRDVVVTYPVTQQDADRVVRACKLLGEALFAAGATRIHLPVAGTAPIRSTRELAGVDTVRPADLTLSTVHLMGTARMGADPSISVCDGRGAVRDVRGLHVADASLFPGPVGVNPQLTVMALATRVAAGIIESW